jgi:hypothetical protein
VDVLILYIDHDHQ